MDLLGQMKKSMTRLISLLAIFGLLCGAKVLVVRKIPEVTIGDSTFFRVPFQFLPRADSDDAEQHHFGKRDGVFKV